MFQLTDIHSLSDFQRNTKRHAKRLKKSGRAIVLTVNGEAEFVVQDAKAYQQLLDTVERIRAIDGIRKGLEEIKQGKTRPIDEVFQEL